MRSDCTLFGANSHVAFFSTEALDPAHGNGADRADENGIEGSAAARAAPSGDAAKRSRSLGSGDGLELDVAVAIRVDAENGGFALAASAGDGQKDLEAL